jgi:hypothetical protein
MMAMMMTEMKKRLNNNCNYLVCIFLYLAFVPLLSRIGEPDSYRAALFFFSFGKRKEESHLC